MTTQKVELFGKVSGHSARGPGKHRIDIRFAIAAAGSCMLNYIQHNFKLQNTQVANMHYSLFRAATAHVFDARRELLDSSRLVEV